MPFRTLIEERYRMFLLLILGLGSSHSAEQKLAFVGISLDSCDKLEAVYNVDEPADNQSEHR